MSGTTDPNIAERNRQLVELGARAPLQAPPRGRTGFERLPVEQQDLDGLALFDVARSTKLI